MSKRSRPKVKEKPAILCSYCSKPIQSDGGKVILPVAVTLDIVPGTANLHNRCLKPYLTRIEIMKERKFVAKTMTPYGWKDRVAQ